MKGSLAAILRVLVLPFGALTGRRIVLDGVNGKIIVYGRTDSEYIRIDPSTGSSVPAIQLHDGASATNAAAYLSAGADGLSGTSANLQSSRYINAAGKEVLQFVSARRNSSVIGTASALDGTLDGASVTATDTIAALANYVNGVLGPQVAVDAAGITANRPISLLGEVWVNGVLSGGNTGTFRFRKVASPPNAVQYDIAINPLGSKASGSTLGTVPAGFAPPNTMDGLYLACNPTTAGGQSPHFYVDPAGKVVTWGLDNAPAAFGKGMYWID